MADARLVPSGLMAWPRVRDLPPCHKLVLYHLWASCESAAGCDLVVPATLAAELGLPQTEVEAALAELERRGLIKSDRRTGEAFITDWARVHRASSPARRRVWEEALGKIASPRLRKIAEKSMRYAFERDAPGAGADGASSTARVRPQPQPQAQVVAPAPAAPPPPWAGCLEVLRGRGVSGQRLRAAQDRLAALRTAEGGELSAADWGRVAEALARADDAAAWLRAVASSGWRREALAEAAYPGETAAQAKARQAQAGASAQQQPEPPDPRAAEEARLRERLRHVGAFLARLERDAEPRVQQALREQVEAMRREAEELTARLEALRAEGVEPRALH